MVSDRAKEQAATAKSISRGPNFQSESMVVGEAKRMCMSTSPAMLFILPSLMLISHAFLNISLAITVGALEGVGSFTAWCAVINVVNNSWSVNV